MTTKKITEAMTATDAATATLERAVIDHDAIIIANLTKQKDECLRTISNLKDKVRLLEQQNERFDLSKFTPVPNDKVKEYMDGPQKIEFLKDILQEAGIHVDTSSLEAIKYSHDVFKAAKRLNIIAKGL